MISNTPLLLGDVLDGFRIGFGYLWVAGWAILSGVMVTSLVQLYVSKERMAAYLGEQDPKGIGLATIFGAASSGCSYGGAAIGKGLFMKGAHPANVFTFMFASTNIIVELGLMLLILLGWQFLLGELIGAIFLIILVNVIVRATLPAEMFETAREELQARDREADISQDPSCGTEGTDEYTITTDGGEKLRFCSKGCLETYEQRLAARGNWRNGLTSWGGWYRLGNQYRKEWSMIYKDVIFGFLIAGFVIVFVPQWVWDTLFMQGDGILVSAQNAVMGVTIAVISFVGSIGNVPFAAALWFSGGIGFAGVIAFIYSDLITIPVLNVFRKYYGWHVMLYILGVFFVSMALTGFLIGQLFGYLGLVPQVVGEADPTAQTFFEFDFTFVMNTVFLTLSAFLLFVYWRGIGAPSEHRDPICGMRVEADDRSVEYDGTIYRLCSRSCQRTFEENPEDYADTHEDGPSDTGPHDHH
ncbi:permease [Natronococcus sp.]|uniref:permease n=1 Tax=Natronococcus sp. TaxID=35747 RepID=UPI003A4D5DBA